MKFELSRPQKLIYNMDNFVRDSVSTITGCFCIDTDFDSELMKKAINCIIRDNEALRVRIVCTYNSVEQVIEDYEYCDIPFIHFESEEAFDTYANEEAQKRIDLNGKLYKFVMFTTPNKKGVLFSVNHIISDAWSMYLLRRELESYYTALLSNRPIECGTYSYVQYIDKVNDYDVSKRYIKDRDYWLNEFSDYENEDLFILNDDVKNSYESKRSVKILSKEDSSDLEALIMDTKSSAFTVMMSLYGICLYKMGNSKDFCIGTSLFNRQDYVDKNTVSMFVNTIPFRITMDEENSFIEFLDKINKKSLSNLKHQRFNYGDLLDEVRKNSYSGSLYDVTFTHQILPLDCNRYNTRWYHCGRQTETLAINLLHDGNQYEVLYDYKVNAMSEMEIDLLHNRMLGILKTVKQNPQIGINQIKAITSYEEQLILKEFNNTKVQYQAGKTIVDLFEDQVRNTPDNVAVYYKNTKYTYSQLNDRVNTIAYRLRKLNVKNNDFVAILAERSFEMIAAIYGILKSGGAYVPIDPTYPKERIQYILEDCKPKAILTYRTSIDTNIPVINLEDPELFNEETVNPQKVNNADDLAYCIYTSGTTGNPKGVMVEHHGIVNLKTYFETAFGVNAEDRILQFANYVFDASVWEINMALLNGASLYIADSELISSTSGFEKYFAENGITVVTLPPNYFLQLSNIRPRLLITAGSESSMAVIKRNVGGRYVNAYGPTETTVCASHWEYDGNADIKKIPIGRPINNTQIYILKGMELCGIGVVGEICIAGIGVVRGYLNREELSAEKFIDNPFGEGKLYRSGDFGRWLPDGNVEYLGRMDEQVKIRGFRVELSEIENVIRNIKNIKDCAVIVKNNASGEKAIYAYLVSLEKLQLSEVKNEMRKLLPEYMIPSYMLQVENIPVTRSGKVDKRALPEITVGDKVEYVAPRNEEEKIICELYSEVLCVEKVGLKDNFFDLGGHSIKAIKLVNCIESKLQVNISVKDIFENPTPEKLAGVLAADNRQEYLPIPKAEKKEYYPMSSQQQRVYFIWQMNREGIMYNMPQSYHLEGSISVDAINKAIQEIINRHEILRTEFKLIDGKPVQKVLENVEFKCVYIEDTKTEETEMIHNFVKPFDLGKAPLIRVQLVKRSEDSYLMMVDMHHIVSDGMSMATFSKEFTTLYNGNQLPPVTHQYKDYSEWMKQRNFDEQKSYWVNEFADSIPVLNMPLDFNRPREQSYSGSTVKVEIGRELSTEIKEFAKQTKTTEYMIFLSAAMVLLGKYSNQDDIVIGSPVSGRIHKDTEDMLGMFVNTLAMRGNLDADKRFRDFLIEMKEKCMKAYKYQDYPFEELIKEIDVPRDISRNPLFDVMLVMQNNEPVSLNMNGVEISKDDMERTISKVDLTFDIVEAEKDFEICLEYCTGLFKAETAARMMTHYIEILKQIIHNMEIKIKDIHAITPEEKNLILGKFNETDAVFPRDKTVIDLFEEQVRKTPDNIAVIYGEDSITYRELNEKANTFAYKLREMNVGPDCFVGIAAKRSIEMIISIYAIMKAGGAYVPIDPNYPIDRVQYMLEDSKVKALLCCHADVDCCENIERIYISDYREIEETEQNPEHINSPRDLLYLIYTSGTTGRPKGVMCHHIGTVNRILWMNSKYPLTEEDRILQKTTFTFDVSVWELFWWGLIGASVVMLKQGEEGNPLAICDTIQASKITTLHFVPSMLNVFLLSLEGHPSDVEKLKTLKYVFTSGEALMPSHSNTFKQLIMDKIEKVRLINLYGPTEASIDVTYYDCTGTEKLVPIGKPISNIKLYVINNGVLCGIGIPGELCITGIGVERGYLNLEELTEKKFANNPYGEGKLYHTGDLVRWMPDGNIEYLGRIDEQVKIRGFRIELGEIASTIRKIEYIHDCAVVVKDGKTGDKNICAYIVSDKEVKEDDIKAELRNSLPYYMIPAYIMQIDAIPVTRNGKLDKRALPEIKIERKKEYLAARNEIEDNLVKIYESILGIDRISVIDNFFDIGGNSIKLVSVFNEIEKIYPGMTKLVDIFSHPTIETMAQFISQRLACKEARSIEIKGMKFPNSFFYMDYDAESSNSFCANIDEQEKNAIENICIENECSVNELLIACYTLLLSQICNTSTIVLHCVVDKSDMVHQLILDIDKIENFWDIVVLVKEKLVEDGNENTYKYSNLVKKVANDEMLIPLFVGNNDEDYSENFDFIIKSNYSGDYDFGIECIFNEHILNQDNVLNLFNSYIKLIKTVSDN